MLAVDIRTLGLSVHLLARHLVLRTEVKFKAAAAESQFPTNTLGQRQ